MKRRLLACSSRRTDLKLLTSKRSIFDVSLPCLFFQGLETDEPTVERQPGPGASLLDSAAETIAPTAIAATSETDRGASSRAGIDPLESDEDGSEDDKQTQPLFFGETEEEDGLAQSGRPAGLGSDAVRAAVLAATRTGSFGSHTELKGLENRVKKRAASPLAGDGQEMEAAKRSKPAGLGIDAVRAAVMQATRTPSPSVSANLVADGPSEVKPSGLGMDAVRAAVIKATRGKANPDQDKLQERAELVDRTEPEPVLPSDANEGRLHAIRKDASTLGGSALAGRTSAGLTSSQNHETLSEKAAIEAARAAAAAAAGEADSSDARLTAFEKKRAERLKRAKMFAAMLGGGAGAASGSVGGSGAGGPGNSVSGTIGGAARDGSAGVSGDVRPDVEGSAQAGRKMAEADQVEEIVEMGGAKAILRSPKEEGELVEEGEERERVAGGDADEGERKERRQKWERRHREDDDTGREETREERRRRRKERRERKAREEDVRNGTAAESGGSGRAETEKDNEREERRRRKRHRERREWEESPEEGEIRGEESSDRGTERYRSRPEEEERFGRSREGIEKRDKSMRESERPRETGRMSEERRERKRERSRERRDKGDRATRKMGTGSAELDTAGVVSGKRAGSERSGRHTRHGRVNEVATGLLAKQEVEGKVHGGETESSSMRGVKNGAESQIDVPESVRAKVRAMLGY